VNRYQVRSVISNSCGDVRSTRPRSPSTRPTSMVTTTPARRRHRSFFACVAGNCCPTCGTADFNGDGDTATDADIEAFFVSSRGGPADPRIVLAPVAPGPSVRLVRPAHSLWVFVLNFAKRRISLVEALFGGRLR